MTQSNPKPTLEQRVQDLCDAIEAGGINKDTGTINDLGEMSILAFAQSVAAEAQPKWVPVGERLPEDYHEVLAWVRRRGTFIAYMEKGRWCLGTNDDGYEKYAKDGAVTHWQPLLTKPEEQS